MTQVAHGLPGYHGDKDKVLARLRRIEGQVRGIERMVEADTYCIDVLTQVAAVTKALQGVGVALLDEHLRHCVAGAAAAGGSGDGLGHQSADLVAEAVAAVQRLLRT